MRRAALWALLLAAAGCNETLDAGGVQSDAGPEDDPLAIVDEPEPGSFDEIHRSIIRRSCAGQPGLCHAGQFEPNLATPASAYAYLVNRPGLEKGEMLRVKPGAPEDSLLMDKLRNRNGVATQMPLGADPLPEAELALIEAWIEDGARRRPGEAAPAMLNELPFEPELAVFDAGGNRIDGASTVQVSVGQTLTLRQSVRDFETADSAMPFVIFVLIAPDGRNVVLRPGQQDPQLGIGSFDATAPLGAGDELNWEFTWQVPATADLYDDATGAITPNVSLSGMTLSLAGAYVDGLGNDGMAALAVRPNTLRVQ